MKHEIELFDILAQRKSLPVNALGRDLIELLILRFRKIEDLDQLLGDVSVNPKDRPAANAIRAMYQEWADTADLVIERVSTLPLKVDAQSLVESLRHSVGRTRARLGSSLDRLAIADQQIERGETLTLQEVRNGLHARARA
jgi:hypothetical protein